MAEDAMMLDPAMDIDDHVSPVPSTSATTVTTSRNALRARRDLPNANARRGSRDALKPRPGTKVQKSSSSSFNHKRRRDLVCPGKIADDSRKLARKNTRCIRRAVASGSFDVRAVDDLAEWVGPSAVDKDEPYKLQRLNPHIVAEALNEPLPGMAFDPAAPLCFTEAEMADLVQALEATQMHLASRGMVRLADEADSLLRGFAREVLFMVLDRPEKLGCRIASDEFWTQVNMDLHWAKKTRWLTRKATKILRESYVDTCPMFSYNMSFPARVDVVMAALKSPGKHPVIDEALFEAKEDIPAFLTARPSTLRSLIAHFEAARARYLANLNTSLDQDNQGNLVASKLTQGLGKLPRNNDQYDSDEDEDGGIRGIIEDGGAEDNAQVEEGVPSGHTQWFLTQLDKWMAMKNGQPQGGVDIDMLSALHMV